MASISNYTEAHLVIAAIRLLEHQKNAPPTIEEVCEILNYSVEHGSRILRKLLEIEAVRPIEGANDTRLFIVDHLKLEDLPKEEKESKFSEDLKKFQENQKGISKKVESITAQQAEKKKNLFAELEKQLKKDSTEK